VGAWGAGAFENDEALDLLADLEAAPPGGRGPRVRAALTLPDGEVGSVAANEAVAAAALVAAATGMPLDRPDAALLAGSGSLPIDPATRSLAAAALAALAGLGSSASGRSQLPTIAAWLRHEQPNLPTPPGPRPQP
jgi:hypothetical protein